MNNKYTYEINIKWEDKRWGTMSSPVLDHAIQVATPPEFPGGMEGIWSPEHLFVASVSSCLMTTFLAIAENSKLRFNSFDIHATGKGEKVDGNSLVGESSKFMISLITLKPVVGIDHQKDKGRAERVLQKAEAACLVSNSVKTTTVMQPEIIINELV